MILLELTFSEDIKDCEYIGHYKNINIVHYYIENIMENGAIFYTFHCLLLR
jgi:hypothetical protein